MGSTTRYSPAGSVLSPTLKSNGTSTFNFVCADCAWIKPDQVITKHSSDIHVYFLTNLLLCYPSGYRQVALDTAVPFVEPPRKPNLPQSVQLTPSCFRRV